MDGLGLYSAQALYLFAPLAVGMVVLGVALRFDLGRWLRRPVDAGLTVRGRRVFGANKTWLGMLCSLLGCTLGVAVQAAVGDRAGDLALIHYRAEIVLPLGATLSLGATAGELINSFVKRQLDVPPGRPGHGWWGPLLHVVDQVDFLVTLWPLLLLWLTPDWPLVLLSFGWTFVLHQAITLTGRRIGLTGRAPS
ncbi:CDP-archaeol synthase [Nonomuraea sp. NPDC051191]|uniref:CDP-archaeol synthase n=1 Tax=Nonomuraea sp. NPDC051191 TaxID=3364372 RepID=UPI0037B34192